MSHTLRSTARAGGLLATVILAALPLAVANPAPAPTPPTPGQTQPEDVLRAKCWKEYFEDLQSCLATFGPLGTTPDHDAKMACFQGALFSFQNCIK